MPKPLEQDFSRNSKASEKLYLINSAERIQQIIKYFKLVLNRWEKDSQSLLKIRMKRIFAALYLNNSKHLWRNLRF